MNRQYEIGDLLYHPKKLIGSKYAIVVKIFDELNRPKLPYCGVPGFGIIWMDSPGDIYEFGSSEWGETEKGFRLAAKGKPNV